MNSGLLLAMMMTSQAVQGMVSAESGQERGAKRRKSSTSSSSSHPVPFSSAPQHSPTLALSHPPSQPATHHQSYMSLLFWKLLKLVNPGPQPIVRNSPPTSRPSSTSSSSSSSSSFFFSSSDSDASDSKQPFHHMTRKTRLRRPRHHQRDNTRFL